MQSQPPLPQPSLPKKLPLLPPHKKRRIIIQMHEQLLPLPKPNPLEHPQPH